MAARNQFMGLRGIENGVTRMHDVFVPADQLVGREGDGLKIALTTLNAGRLAIPALCAAAAKWSLKIAREWSAARVQWGRQVGKHAAVAQKLSFMAATAYALEAILDLSGQMADEGRNDIRIEAALEAEKLSARMLLQVHDELIFEVEEAEIEKTLPVVVSVMENAAMPAISMRVPLQVDARAADNWDEAH